MTVRFRGRGAATRAMRCLGEDTDDIEDTEDTEEFAEYSARSAFRIWRLNARSPHKGTAPGM